MTDLIAADAALFRWLMADADRCAGIVADTYKDWDGESNWQEALRAQIQYRETEVPHGN